MEENLWKLVANQAYGHCKNQVDEHPDVEFSYPKMELFEKLCDRINRLDDYKLDVHCDPQTENEIQTLYGRLVEKLQKKKNTNSGGKSRTIKFSGQLFRKGESELDETRVRLYLLLTKVLFGVSCNIVSDQPEVTGDGKFAFVIDDPSTLKDGSIKTIPRRTATEIKEDNSLLQNDEEVDRYICHYIRSGPSDAGQAYNKPGIGILELYPKQSLSPNLAIGRRKINIWKATLTLHYLDNQASFHLEGYFTHKSKSNYFVRVQQITEEDRLVLSQLSFAKSKDFKETLIGTYSSIRKGDVENTATTPISGVMVCVKSPLLANEEDKSSVINMLLELESFESNSDDLSLEQIQDNELKNIYLDSWAIRYYLADKRFSALPGGQNSLSKKGFRDAFNHNTYKDWYEIIYKKAHGYYEGYYLKTTSLTEPTFEQFIFLIREDGRAEMKVQNQKENHYFGYVRITNENGGLLSYFDYEPNFDFYRFELFLDQYRESDVDYLYGCFAGFEKDFSHNKPIAGRILLRKIKNFSASDFNTKKPITYHPKIERDTVLKLFEADPVLKKFFNSENDLFKNLTGSGYWKNFFQEGINKEDNRELTEEEKIAFLKFKSSGYTLFMYYDNDLPKKQIFDLHVVEKSFLTIHPDGSVNYVTGPDEILSKGQINLIDNVFYVEIQLVIGGRMYIIFQNKTLFGQRIHLSPHDSIDTTYGLSLMVSGDKIEARTTVLSSSYESNNDNLYEILNVYDLYRNRDSQRNETLIRLRELDSIHSGAISYITGSTNRYLKTTKLLKEPFEPRTKHERQVHFYAACRLAELYGNELDAIKKAEYLEDCKIYIRKAYIHGFATDTFAGLHLKEAKMQMQSKNEFNKQKIIDMLTDIEQERQLLQKQVINGCFTNTSLREEIERLWELDIQKNKSD